MNTVIRRIHITGNAGSGKSTLARAIGKSLGLPVKHLDGIVWQSGWRKAPRAEREKAEAIMIASDTWIIEGVSRQVRAAADLVVFLDVPRPLCLYRAFKRNLPYLFRSRPELPERCPEILIIPKLIGIIMRFPGLARCELLEEAGMSGRYRVIRGNRELARFVEGLVMEGIVMKEKVVKGLSSAVGSYRDGSIA
jgi:adenylate kinase family enzyme